MPIFIIGWTFRPHREDRAISPDAATRILFITRRYPPVVGGIETHSYQIYTRLSAQRPVKLVALRRQSLAHLAWFLPYAFVVAFVEVLLRRVQVVYFSDGVVGALALFLRPFTRRIRFVVTIHGLEMIYGNPLARRLMHWSVRCCEQVAINSQLTRELTAQSGVAPEKLVLIYMGVEPLVLPEERCNELRQRFEQEYGLRFGRDRVLLNCGRQVRRKGLAAFLEKGVPLLDPDIRLIIGGRGPELSRLYELAKNLDLHNRVLILGPLEEELVAMLRRSADLFIMPNIHLPNDVEGFGMAPLETMYAGTPVVAFAVDALVESMREGGYLIPAGDYLAFVDQVHRYYILSPNAREAKIAEARAYVRREYSWDKSTRQYIEVLEKKL